MPATLEAGKGKKEGRVIADSAPVGYRRQTFSSGQRHTLVIIATTPSSRVFIHFPQHVALHGYGIVTLGTTCSSRYEGCVESCMIVCLAILMWSLVAGSFPVFRLRA
jgi:hypothetical protein